MIECVATDSELTASVATPEPSSDPVPSDVAPSRKVTVPVGIPVPGAVTTTVAVKVIDWPKTGEATELTTVPVVAAWPTVWVVADETLVWKFASPPYEAVIECAGRGSA